MIARHDRAVELGQTLIAKATQLNDPVGLTVGHRSLGSTLFTLGDFVGARSHLERAVGLQQIAPNQSSSLILSYAVDPRVAAQLILAWNLWILGYPEQSLRQVQEALSRAVEQANPYTLAFAQYVAAAVRLLRGEFPESLVHADRGLSIATEHRIDLYVLYSRFARGCALAKVGKKEQALVDVREAVEAAHRNNLRHMRGFMLAWLSTIQMEIGDLDAAHFTVSDALKQVNDVAGRAFEAELRRLSAQVLLLMRPDAVEESEHGYNQAIGIAQNQRARSVELRATVSLAQLLRRQDRNEEARRRLAAIFGWFTEGFDTADLLEAKGLLEALGSVPVH
jgi:tetratricopeptide (TPR) repeat protein